MKNFSVMLVMMLALAGRARAQPGAPYLTFGLLPCAGESFARASGVRQLVWELVKRTSVEARPEVRAVSPASEEIYTTPLVLWSCRGAVAPLDEEQRRGLGAFLRAGGMIWADDAGMGEGEFRTSLESTLAQVLPGVKWTSLPPEHVLFKSFFLVGQAAGRRADAGPRALVLDERLAVVYTGSDLLGAMSRNLLGGWEFECQPGGERQREESFRLAINLVVYSLCLDYKNDRVHLPFILRRRKL